MQDLGTFVSTYGSDMDPGTQPLASPGTATEAPATDIDGDARPQGAAVDIGADESP